MHASEVFVGIATSNELFDLKLPEPPTQFSAQGGLNDRRSAGITTRSYQSIKFTNQLIGQTHRNLRSHETTIPNWDAISIRALCQIMPIMHIMSLMNLR